MKLTGQKLKEKRESARLTISEVSLATKINPKVLTAMESGDEQHLPAKTFLRGFVKAYAGFLKMNVAEVMELFNQELGEAAQKEVLLAAPAEPAQAPAKKLDMTGEGSNAFRMIVIGSILLLIVLIIGVRSVVQKYEKERNVDATPDLSTSKVTPLEEKKPDAPAADAAAPAATTPPEIKPEEKKEPEKVEAKKEEVKPEVKAEAPAPAVVPAAPLPEVKIAEKLAEKPEEKKPEEKKAEEKKDEKKDEKPVAKGKRHEIILEALDKVDVKYKLKGDSKKISLSPGQVHTIVTNEPISFDVSDGGALNITDNGRDKGPAGDLGHRKQVNIP